jgi:hypothetical protein
LRQQVISDPSAASRNGVFSPGSSVYSDDHAGKRVVKRTGSVTELLEHFHGTSGSGSGSGSVVGASSSSSSSLHRAQVGKGMHVVPQRRQLPEGSLTSLTEDELVTVAKIMKKTGFDRSQAIQVYLNRDRDMS